MDELLDFRSVLEDHCARRRSTAETMRLLHLDSVEDLVVTIIANRLTPPLGDVPASPTAMAVAAELIGETRLPFA